jgi:GMP synthase-like glutamine amidotransferase
MILIVDLCYRKDSLSSPEFVLPIAEIVRETGEPYTIRHFAELEECDRTAASRILLCGTALKDNTFVTYPERFAWIPRCVSPVLGICAGMQAIATAFGGRLVAGSEIGMTGVRVTGEDPLFSGKAAFEAYELHTYGVRIPPSFEVLAESAGCIQAIRHRSLPIYGVMFHPEVRNAWVVERFVREIPAPRIRERPDGDVAAPPDRSAAGTASRR